MSTEHSSNHALVVESGRHPYATLARYKWVLVALSVLVSANYLTWRALHTLNYESTPHLVLSLLLLGAELYGFVSMGLFFLHVAALPPFKSAAHLDESELPTVDILIPIYNEPSEILYRTLVGCDALDYPKSRMKLYVLDDGQREAIRRLAAEFGARYLTRPDRTYAKAGNLNNALKHSSGDIVVVFDCDHVPVRSFLRETVGFFKDPKVGFVQLPHHFYNPDAYQRNLRLERELAHEQDLFFHVVLPGRQLSNAVMFAGSSALLRRSALAEIGGIQSATAIEDTHTGMRLQAKGYRAIYLPKILSAALSPESFSGYLTQRCRWTRGGIQMFVLDNPLFRSGLTLKQRLHYFASIFFFFHGWARLVFMLAPLSFLLFSYNPIITEIKTLLMYFIPHYVIAHLTLAIIGREYRNPFWSDVYEVAVSFHLSWTALVTVLRPERLIFNVTPKGSEAAKTQDREWLSVVPHGLLLLLLAAGVLLATHELTMTGLHLDAFLLSCFWAVYNIILVGCAVEASRERAKVRKDYRLRRDIPCEILYGHTRLQGRTLDLSDSGALIELAQRWYLPRQCRIRLLSDYGEATELDAVIQRKEWLGEQKTRLGVQFKNIDEEIRRGLIRQAFSSPRSWESPLRPRPLDSINSLRQILTALFSRRLRKTRPMRRWPRVAAEIRCEISYGNHRLQAWLQDISSIGASLSVPRAQRLPHDFTIHLPLNGAVTSIQAKLVRSRMEQDGLECMARFEEPDHIDLTPLIRPEIASVI
ncbi:MAG: glycosyltransferase [Elusimicrobia bacterium]|nr:glycosyltransferase [Elusimicrobiota bacterium]